MIATHAAATFTAARRELIGPDGLLGAAEIARGVCRDSDRRLELLAITPDRMRRIDAWLTDNAVVTHPVAGAADRAVIGTVCARHHADELVGSIIQSLVGSVPNTWASEPVELPPLASLGPASLPAGVRWVLVAGATTDTGVERWIAAAVGSGLVGAEPGDPDAPIRLEPVGPIPSWARIARLLGPATAATSIAPHGGSS